MADNSVQDGTDTIRDKDRAGVKTQIFGLDVAIGTATEALMSPANPMPVALPAPGTSAATSVTAATTDTSVLAANTARRGATVFNEAGQTAHLLLGAVSSLTAYTAQVSVGGYYEVPFGWTGAVRAITATGTATLRVTELT